MLEGIFAVSVIVCALLIARRQNRMIGAFIVLFAAYYYIGWLFANNMTPWQLNYYSLAVSALLVGVLMANLLVHYRRSLAPQSKPNDEAFAAELQATLKQSANFYLKLIVLSLYAIGVLAYVALIALYGVPVLNIGDRSAVPGYFTYIIGVIWVLYPYLYVTLERRHVLPATALTFFILLTMGYRTPLVITILCFIFLNLKYQRFVISRRMKILGVLLLFAVASLYPLIRFQEDPQALITLLGNLDLPPELFLLAPFILVFAEGSSVILGIHQMLPSIGPQYGAFTLSGFATVLPGEQIHSRTLLSYWLGRTNWQESSTTSSLLGQFLIEFGYWGSIVCCLLLGFFMALGSQRYFESTDRMKDLPFVLVFGLLTIGIHTGVLDPLVVYALILYCLVLVADRLGGPLAQFVKARYRA
jgi:oligosaccharide repeat unit polymerase